MYYIQSWGKTRLYLQLLSEFRWVNHKRKLWYFSYGYVINGNYDQIYTLTCHKVGNSWNPVVIDNGTTVFDPKQLLITRSELTGILSCILSWVTALDLLNSKYYLFLKVVLSMWYDSKSSLKGLQKRVDSHPTQKMWKRSNSDILKKI